MKKINFAVGIFVFLMLTHHATAALIIAEPVTKVHKVGDNFDINVSIDPQGVGISGAQSNIGFNGSVVNLNEVREGDLFNRNGVRTFYCCLNDLFDFWKSFYGPFTGGIHNNEGIARNFFNVVIGPNNETITPGIFLIINGTVVGSGVNKTNRSEKYIDMPISLLVVKISDPNGTSVPVGVTDGAIFVKAQSVVNRITVSPVTKTMAAGGTVFTPSASGKDQFDAPFSAKYAWSSDNTTVAVVNATTGKITALLAGTANISATNDTIMGSALLTVENRRLTVVTVLPNPKTMSVSSVLTFSASGKDQFSSPYSAKYIWSSSNPVVAAVNATTGKVTALSAGNAVISATNGTITGSSLVTV